MQEEGSALSVPQPTGVHWPAAAAKMVGGPADESALPAMLPGLQLPAAAPALAAHALCLNAIQLHHTLANSARHAVEIFVHRQRCTLLGSQCK